MHDQECGFQLVILNRSVSQAGVEEVAVFLGVFIYEGPLHSDRSYHIFFVFKVFYHIQTPLIVLDIIQRKFISTVDFLKTLEFHLCNLFLSVYQVFFHLI